MKQINFLDLSEQSTRQREKKFSRTGNRSHSKSPSNRSQSSSLSKFYVKNIINQQHTKNQQLLNKNVERDSLNLSENSLKRNISSRQSKQKVYQQNLIQQVELLKKQIKNCYNYLKKQSDKAESLDKQRNQAIQNLHILQSNLNMQLKKNSNLKQQNDQLKENLAKKQLSKSCKCKCNPLQKLKISYLQCRIDQYEQQINKLKNQVIQLQNQKDFRCNLTAKNISLKSNNQMEANYLQKHEISKGLEHRTRGIQIKHHLQLRKLHQQMDFMKNQKEQQYCDLKKKFIRYLEKYKDTISKKVKQKNDEKYYENKEAEQDEINLSISQQSQDYFD